MSGTSSHVLNMACGDSAAGAIVALGRCGADFILVQPDVLYCGPLRRWVGLNGLGDRAGGVHLDSREGRVWFRDGHHLVAVL